MIISTPNLQQAKNQINSSKEKPIIVKSLSDEFSRKILEYGKFQILLLPEFKGKDKLKQLNSGLNHVLAKIATKNKIVIGVDVQQLRKLDKKQKALELARIKLNIKICRKARCGIKLLNVKDGRDARALLESLGASTQQTKENL